MPHDLLQPTAQERAIQSALNAWKRFMTKPHEVIFFGGAEVKVSDVTELLESQLGRHTRARQLEHEHRRAVKTRNEHVKEDRQLHSTLENFVRTRLAKEEGALVAFGIVDVQPKKPSSDTLTIAVANRLKTRRLRQTMGRRQREAITREPQLAVVIVGPDGRPMNSEAPDPDPTGTPDGG